MKTSVQSHEPVFVFGSDLDGTHDGESAAAAVRFHSAETGVWSGPTGNGYVIPYLDSAQRFPLPIEVIKNYVDPFIVYAATHARLKFQVARFACDQDAHTDALMARLFSRVPDNCDLPGVWSCLLNPKQPARLLVFDPDAHLADVEWQSRLEQYLALNAPLWDFPSVEMVSVGDPRAIAANSAAAKKLDLMHRIFGANEAYYGKNAGIAAECNAVWYATHILSISDFAQTAQPQQMRIIRAAARAGLQLDQLDIDAD